MTKFQFLEEADIALVRPILECEGLRVQSIQLDDQGLDNFTFLVNEELIVRFPRRDRYRMDLECWALKAVAAKTSLATPHLEFVGAGEWPFVAYRRIPGVKLASEWPNIDPETREIIASQVGELLWELHEGADAQSALEAGIPVDDWRESCDDVSGWISSGGAPEHWHSFLAECVERITRQPTEPAEMRLLHFDAHADNVIYDPERRRVSGIIDFGDVVVGDPRGDIAIAGFIDYEMLDPITLGYEASSGRQMDRTRIWDLYVVASAADIATGLFDCSPDVQNCYERWKRGQWP
jgi:aminoglycoside 2''-phosphotransferase